MFNNLFSKIKSFFTGLTTKKVKENQKQKEINTQPIIKEETEKNIRKPKKKNKKIRKAKTNKKANIRKNSEHQKHESKVNRSKKYSKR